MMIGNGMSVDFWGDVWCVDVPFKEIFSDLFDIYNEPLLAEYGILV
jgi:hypothetical protein